MFPQHLRANGLRTSPKSRDVSTRAPEHQAFRETVDLASIHQIREHLDVTETWIRLLTEEDQETGRPKFLTPLHLDDLFTGTNISATRCLRCGRVNHTHDTFMMLTLPLLPDKEVDNPERRRKIIVNEVGQEVEEKTQETIEDAIGRFVQPERTENPSIDTAAIREAVDIVSPQQWREHRDARETCEKLFDTYLLPLQLGDLFRVSQGIEWVGGTSETSKRKEGGGRRRAGICKCERKEKDCAHDNEHQTDAEHRQEPENDVRSLQIRGANHPSQQREVHP
eukprot:Cvel_14160.t1-p1 / transcript=Cvel_14160.t1 / gene=Cvel_14160 / organism=Chromera_velia_CCMP2878 / gene_product=hypothetical protein / transcript_product=hypothetical protein / location=Cvel_scaffold997:53237-59621(+) / protein_length=280 / sequence_SO=supercontig / SO=protein_coding / is_pseudo=false